MDYINKKIFWRFRSSEPQEPLNEGMVQNYDPKNNLIQVNGAWYNMSQIVIESVISEGNDDNKVLING